MLCYCVEEVDLEVFRGVFVNQWLSGRAHAPNEKMFFCTACGPPEVVTALKDGGKRDTVEMSPGTKKSGTGSKSVLGTPLSTLSSAGKEKSSFSFRKFFTGKMTSTKKDGSLSREASSMSFASPTSTTTATPGQGNDQGSGGSDNGLLGGSAACSPMMMMHGPPPVPHLHPNALSSIEHELPATPRSDQELFLCTTCGACYCRSHAADHHYSRRRPADDHLNWGTGGSGSPGTGPSASGDAAAADGGCANPFSSYPHHSFFIGVPSYVSTHPSHVIEETEWGLLLPTIILKEVENGQLDLAKIYRYFNRSDELLDVLFAKAKSNGKGGGGCINVDGSAAASVSAAPGTPMRNLGSPRNSHSHLDIGSLDSSMRTFSLGTFGTGTTSASQGFSVGGGGGLSGAGRMLTPLRPVTSHDTSAADDPSWGPLSTPATAEAAALPVSGLVYCNNGSDKWSYLAWCARCGARPVRLPAKRYDDSNSRHCHLRRLGQTVAILAYLCRRGIMLDEPPRYVSYKATSDALARRRQLQMLQQSPVASAADAQTANKSAEATSEAGQSSSALCLALPPSAAEVEREAIFDYTNGESAGLTRSETDQVMARASLCGFTNPSFLCYMNSVLQCTLRCSFFTRPLLKLPAASVPGKLTASYSRLLHHMAHETEQDVVNSAVNPFVKSVYQQICRISSLFEQDEQQDAQELLITLLNGIADEFDAGKSAEEKRTSKRISFEGTVRSEVVCLHCHHVVPREEMFMALPVPIKGSIEEGLQTFFAPALLEGKDRYACEYCFQKLSPEEQIAHNEVARAQREERRRLRSEGKRAGEVGDDPSKDKVENCLYEEAEVRTKLTRLGGTLAIHLLRFHFDQRAQDFVKIAAPVRIPLTLDLSSYISEDVAAEYARERCLRVLRSRFPGVADSVLDRYLTAAEDEPSLATKQLLADGYGVDANLESSITSNQDESNAITSAPSATTGPTRTNIGLPPASPSRKGQPGPSAPRSPRTPLMRQATVPTASDDRPYPLGSGAKSTPPEGTKETPSAMQKSAGLDVIGASAGHIGKERSVFLDEDEDDDDFHVEDSERQDDSAARESRAGDDAHSPGFDSTVEASPVEASLAIGGTSVSSQQAANSLSNAVDGVFQAAKANPSAAPLPLKAISSNHGLSTGPLPATNSHGLLVPASSLSQGPAVAGAAPGASLSPQCIMKLRREDFDAFGDNSVAISGSPTLVSLGNERRSSFLHAGALTAGRAPTLTRQLVAIVTHRGSLHGGHYMAYVRYLARPELWFRCDDEIVDVVTEKAVLACAGEVYLAFYE